MLTGESEETGQKQEQFSACFSDKDEREGKRETKSMVERRWSDLSDGTGEAVEALVKYDTSELNTLGG